MQHCVKCKNNAICVSFDFVAAKRRAENSQMRSFWLGILTLCEAERIAETMEAIGAAIGHATCPCRGSIETSGAKLAEICAETTRPTSAGP